MKKIIIIGGVAGGAGAAARLRRLSESDEIIMFEKGPYISYANCGLPYYVGEVITDKKKLLVQTVEGMSKRFNLDIRVNQEVTNIDKESKTITVKNIQTSEVYEENYDKLIISTGAEAFIPPIEGINEINNMFTLKTVPDTLKVYDYIKENNVKKATVIGAGFIGVETAENLIERGIDTTLIDVADQILAGPADFEMAQFLHNELNRHKMKLVFGDLVVKIDDDGKTILTKNGLSIETDMIIMAAGIRPASKIAVDAKLEVDEKTKGIIVNSNFKTSDDDIYAVGDAIMLKDYILGGTKNVPLAWPANRQGRQVADAINGLPVTNDKIYGASVIKVFDLTFASIGLTEKQAKQNNINFETFFSVRNNHAGYYPGATPITLKVIYDKDTGKIYGAQAVGQDGTEKRIDVIATAMHFDGKITDLSSIELCYAPPFNSAKDPVNISGYIGENIFNGDYSVVQWHQIDNIVANGGYLLDVRTPAEFELGAIAGAVNIELDSIRDNKDKLPTDKNAPIYVTCQVGHRGYLAVKILKNIGYTKVINLTGGYKVYSTAHKNFENNNPITKKKVVDTMSVKTSNDNVNTEIDLNNLTINNTLDACGLQCPGPIMQTKLTIDKMNDGEILKVNASDPGFMPDIEAWCEKTCNTLIDVKMKNKVVTAIIKKGLDESCKLPEVSIQKNTTMVVFSGDLDKVLASMIIANGAAAMGQKVTLFFTFWGLNALRKNNKVKVKKTFMEKMFGRMMPRGSKKLKLSKMHMSGMGTKMIKSTMKKKNVDSLEDLIKQALDLGVEMIACTMSMDLMGIKESEIIDGVTYAGVAKYIGQASDSTVTLFV